MTNPITGWRTTPRREQKQKEADRDLQWLKKWDKIREEVLNKIS